MTRSPKADLAGLKGAGCLPEGGCLGIEADRRRVGGAREEGRPRKAGRRLAGAASAACKTERVGETTPATALAPASRCHWQARHGFSFDEPDDRVPVRRSRVGIVVVTACSPVARGTAESSSKEWLMRRRRGCADAAISAAAEEAAGSSSAASLRRGYGTAGEVNFGLQVVARRSKARRYPRRRAARPRKFRRSRLPVGRSQRKER